MYQGRKKLKIGGWLAAVLLLLQLSLFTVSTARASQGPSTPAEMESFLDQLFKAEMEASHIPGGMVAVVKDGQLFTARGYGYANLETRQPVDTGRTLFHVGSLTKLFTWTAVLQLVEQGKLDLQADVNRYLPAGFQIPATYPQPITLFNLLTHTAGFEDQPSVLLAHDPAELEPLGQYLKEVLPARVFPPGQFSVYSNYGASLAGYIVERVSGQPYEQYLENNILKPLEMNHTNIRQPYSPELAANIAPGYLYLDGKYTAREEGYGRGAPMGSLSTTALDMANFMIAQLDSGRFKDKHILSEAMTAEMQRQHFTNDPHLAGITYGFIEENQNGLRLLTHDGALTMFRAFLALVPDQKLGVFMAFDAPAAGEIIPRLWQKFLDHYYPTSPSAPPKALPDAKIAADKVAGYYQSARRPFTNADKIFNSNNYVVEAKPDGSLQFAGERYLEVEPLVFKEENGQDTLVFRGDSQGHPAYLFRDSVPAAFYTRVDLYQTVDFSVVVMMLCQLIFILAPVAWLVTGIRARRTSKELKLPVLNFYHWWAGTMCILNITFGVLVVVALAPVVANLNDSMFGYPVLFKVALALPLVSLVLLIGALIFGGLAWKNRSWNLPDRILYSLVGLSGIIFTLWLNYWNLLGYHI